jgi:hypothetical protein
MKNKYYFAILMLYMLLFSNCGCFLPNYYAINFANEAEHDVYFYVLDCKGKYINTAYPDTVISFDKKYVGRIKSHSYFVDIIGTLPIENYFDKLPNDTLSIFYFHPDTLIKYSWSEIKTGYKILQRYDLSIEDVTRHKNKYDVPEIPYPPDERMKNMKMYPPYDNYGK